MTKTKEYETGYINIYLRGNDYKVDQDVFRTREEAEQIGRCFSTYKETKEIHIEK